MPIDACPAIETVNLTRRFGDVTALDRVSISILRGEFFSLLGPSGCGKTTLLRLIAGLDLADAGTLKIDGTDASALPAHQRPVNTVFQSYALFPHLDVFENVAFGLRMKKVPQEELRRRVDRILNRVEIQALASRRPNQLSGGQKQRVALARAIVNEPRVLLLDEPLAALDLKLRKQLQIELRVLQRQLGITFIYVTHDQEEALVLSDRIAVMREGRIEQMGDARALYERPRTRFVSQFLGSSSLIDGRVKQALPNGFLAETPLGVLQVDHPCPRREQITLAIRPEQIRLLPATNLPTTQAHPNHVIASIGRRLYVGSESHFELHSGTVTLHAQCMNSYAEVPVWDSDQNVRIELPPQALIVLED